MATGKNTGKKKAVETEDQALARLVKITGRSCVLDAETTGLSPRGDNPDRIVEIGIVEVINRQPTGRRFHAYINPQREVNREALAVHGLTNTFLVDKPRFRDVWPAMREFVAGAEIVIHNAPFDVGFLDMELDRLGLEPFSTNVRCITDTLPIAKEVWTGKRNSLDALCDRLKVSRAGRQLHGALLDADLLAEVYLQMGKGQNDLLLAGGATVEEIQQGDIGDGTSLEGAPPVIVLAATDAELALHGAYLAGMEKDGKNLSIWTKLERGLNPLEAYGLDGMPVVKALPPVPKPAEPVNPPVPTQQTRAEKQPLPF
jgi:DNA polymerase-3 subunit epsilon